MLLKRVECISNSSCYFIFNLGYHGGKPFFKYTYGFEFIENVGQPECVIANSLYAITGGILAIKHRYSLYSTD